MYIWIGLVLSESDEDYIRNICKKINKIYNLSEESFTLPQHISLKTSFYSGEYIEVINYIKKILYNVSSFSINIIGISKINNGVIWLDVEEIDEIRHLHNLLNEELLNEYDIPLKGFDGDNFKFHSTLFQDLNISEEHNEMVNKLLNRFDFPIGLKIKEINIGISEIGKVGTFKVCDKIELI